MTHQCIFLSCKRNSVSGRSMCSKCYNKSLNRINTGICICGENTNDGKSLCQHCYDTILRRKICYNCHVRQANIGKNLCQQCYDEHMDSMIERPAVIMHRLQIANNPMCECCGQEHSETNSSLCFMCKLLIRINIDPRERKHS